jgi:hypothetical protein
LGDEIFQTHTYYTGYKSACGFDFKLISFETPGKLKCVEDLMKGIYYYLQIHSFSLLYNQYQPASGFPMANSGFRAPRLAATGTTGGATAKTSLLWRTTSNSPGRRVNPQMSLARSASPLISP